MRFGSPASWGGLLFIFLTLAVDFTNSFTFRAPGFAARSTSVRGIGASASIDGVQEFDMDSCRRTEEGLAFPLCLESTNPSGGSAESWVTLNKKRLIEELVPLHGAVLLRGFEVPTAADFSDVVKATGLEEQPYIGGNAVRTVVADRVFTANEAPPSEKIPFHHEMAQVPRFPTKIMFYCEQPSEKGGETPIVLSCEVCSYIKEKHFDLFERFKKEGVRYIRTMPSDDDASSALGRGWKGTYCGGKDDKALAEKEMRADGVLWEWLPNGDLKTTSKKLSAIRDIDGRDVFFNQVVAAYTGWNDSRNTSEDAVVFGDTMDKLPAEAMKEIVAKMDSLAVAFPWEQGDVLFIDNRRAMHSRKPFVRPRRVLASLAR